LRGQYENKIRMEATFTKVFETFASKVEGEELVMDYFDLLRSICNFCYSTRKTQELFDLSREMLKSSKILELFDLDKSNSFSIYEVRVP
jgi:predicted site-specific integrase-resolvase